MTPDITARAILLALALAALVGATTALAIEPVSRPVAGVERPFTAEEAAEYRRMMRRPLGRLTLPPGGRLEIGPMRDGRRGARVVVGVWS